MGRSTALAVSQLSYIPPESPNVSRSVRIVPRTHYNYLISDRQLLFLVIVSVEKVVAMAAADPVWYFAYGSNMNSGVLEKRRNIKYLSPFTSLYIMLIHFISILIEMIVRDQRRVNSHLSCFFRSSALHPRPLASLP